jgi:hypothetical protein
MNQAHLVEMFKAWEAIDDAEKAIGEFLYGEDAREEVLQDLLGDLIDRNMALSGVLRDLLGEPVEAVREKTLQAMRDACLGGEA